MVRAQLDARRPAVASRWSPEHRMRRTEMTKASSVFAFCSLLAVAACGPAMRDDDGTGDDGTGDDNGGGGGDEGIPRQCDKMDIVFIVDNSGSMQEEQSNLGSNFPMFAQLLNTYTVSNGQP